MNQYEVIFIGYPVWATDVPQAIIRSTHKVMAQTYWYRTGRHMLIKYQKTKPYSNINSAKDVIFIP